MSERYQTEDTAGHTRYDPSAERVCIYDPEIWASASPCGTVHVQSETHQDIKTWVVPLELASVAYTTHKCYRRATVAGSVAQTQK